MPPIAALHDCDWRYLEATSMKIKTLGFGAGRGLPYRLWP
jgi:hypothetical protein